MEKNKGAMVERGGGKDSNLGVGRSTGKGVRGKRRLEGEKPTIS